MATEHLPSPGDAIPYPDELPGEPLTGELPPITAADIARTAGRLEAGRASNAYTLGPTDLDVLIRLTPEQWQVVKRTPSALTRILTPTIHA